MPSVTTQSRKRRTMKMRRALMLSAPIALALTASAHLAAAEDAPKDNLGYTTPKTVMIDLGKGNSKHGRLATAVACSEHRAGWAHRTTQPQGPAAVVFYTADLV